MKLTGSTSNQLQYLERSGLAEPERVWNGKKKPEVYYSWQKLINIRAIRSFREKTSLQVIRKILDFFEEYNADKNLKNKQIVAVDSEVFWVETDWSDLGAQLSVSKRIGQYTLLVVPAFDDVVRDVWTAAERSSSVDFQRFKDRAKASPVEVTQLSLD